MIASTHFTCTGGSARVTGVCTRIWLSGLWRSFHRYIDVWEYPDGRIEIRADGKVLPCRPYNKLAEVDQGAVIEHKRLNHALQVAQAMQAQRDNRRISGSPSRTNLGQAVRKPKQLPGTKKQREFMQADINEVVVELAQRRQPKRSGKPGRRSATAV